MENKPQKVILFLDVLAKSDYKKFLDLYDQYSDATHTEIWEAYPLIQRKIPKNHKFDKSGILETFLLINYCKKNHIEYEIWYYKSLFVFNDDLFMIENNSIKKIEIFNTIILTMRDNWKHPFFKVLQQVLEKNNGKLARTNEAILNDVGCMNKFYGISKLYAQREQYLQNICVPYILHNSDYGVFVEFLRKNLGEIVVLKTDCKQEGKGIVFRKISSDTQNKEIISFFDTHFYSGKPFFILPALHIKEEYRLYFVRSNESYKIYSIKKRKNILENQDLIGLNNIQIYKNLPVKWEYVAYDSKEFLEASSIAVKMLDLLNYHTGCIEFVMTQEDEIVFLEVNQMAAPLTFDGEDIEAMSQFYTQIFQNIVTF